MYEQYCVDHYGDGRCDQGCNSQACGWDGLDCADGSDKEKLADGVLVIVVLITPEELIKEKRSFLQKLSAILRTSLRFRKDKEGNYMIKPYRRSKVAERRMRRELDDDIIG